MNDLKRPCKRSDLYITDSKSVPTIALGIFGIFIVIPNLRDLQAFVDCVIYN